MSARTDIRDSARFGNPFCPLLFLNYHLTTEKKVKVCCYSENYLDTSGDQIDNFNSSQHREIRQDSLDGVWHKHCLGCKSLEDRKQISFRQKALRDAIDHSDILQQQIAKHHRGEDLEPYWYDLRISNLCNLECQMCGPTASSTIAKKRGLENPYLEFEPDMHVNPCSSRLYLAGGEPFLIKKFVDILDKIDNLDCEIVVNTNCTIRNERMIKALKKFKNVNLTLSLDGFGKLNDSIRRGSEWKKIEENISHFRNEGFQLHVTTVLQRDNVNELIDLADFVHAAGVTKWTLSELIDPSEFHWSNATGIDVGKLRTLMEFKLVKQDVSNMLLINNILK